jgi:methionyl-tRNA formyltransferase
MGTPDYAWVILEKLLNSHDIEVVAVFTQPDKPVGRKHILTPPFVKKQMIDKKIDIKICQPENLRNKNIQNSITKLSPDYIIVAAYGQILPKSILEIAPCINLHASLLPKYRGASPIQSAILNLDKYTGITAMLMNEGLDRGDIIGYEYVKLNESIILGKLFDKLSFAASSLSIEVLRNFSALKPIKQYDLFSSYSKKIKKSDGLVDFDDAKEIYTKFRAFYPWPGIYLINNLKIKKMKISNKTNSSKKGEIIAINNEHITISCCDGAVDLYRVQPSSKKEMDAKEYILGKRLKVGDNLL